MYRAYEEKNDSPFLRSLIYISILELFTLAVAYLYAKEILIRIFNIQEIDIEKPLYIWSIAVFILIANYFFYSRVSVAEMEQKFGKRDKLNQSIRLWMLIVFPFIIFFGGIVMYVLLFGGVLFGKQIEGFFQ